MVLSGDPEVSNILTNHKNKDKPHFNESSPFMKPKAAMLYSYYLYRRLHVAALALVAENILATYA